MGLRKNCHCAKFYTIVSTRVYLMSDHVYCRIPLILHTPGKKCLEIARGKCPDFLPEVANNFGGLVMNLQGEILGILSVAPFNCCSSWVTGV